MTWDYVAGFFDADGSVCYTRNGKHLRKTIQISFHNSEEVILKKIRAFILEELGYRGSLVKKKATNENHQDSYDLKYLYNAASEVAKRIKSIHPKKRHRFNILLAIQKLKPRNGKYTDKIISKIRELELKYK